MKRSTIAHRKLLTVQKRIFKSLKNEVDHLLGEAPPSILRYEREYQREFQAMPLRPKALLKKELIRAIRKADVTFIADFHTFSQAQKTALRLIREAVRPQENWFIGLELVPSRFQRTLDSFQAGKLSLKEFHHITQYDHEWGFPWAHYAPLFHWAKEHKIPLLALNEPKEFLFRSVSAGRWFKEIRDREELHERDLWAAGIITDLFSVKRSRPRLIVLYGELHVSRNHLPAHLEEISKKQLGKPLQSISIHQNYDKLFWALAKDERELKTEILRVKKDSYCVFSSTPWAKLQSILNWAEQGGLQTEVGEEAELDHLSLFSTYGNAVAEFFGLERPSLESVHVLTIHEADFMDRLKKSREFTDEEIRLIRFHVDYNFGIFIPRAKIAYAGTATQNRLAELAALHLARTASGSRSLFSHEPDDFFRLVLEAAFGFFGSLILNPRRKCDLYEDHEKRLQSLSQGQKQAFSMEYEARKLAYDLLSNENEFLRGKTRSFRIAEFMSHRAYAPAAMIAARYVGRALGKRLYPLVFEGKIEASLIRDLCLARPTRARQGYEKRFSALLRVATRTESASSKTATL